MAYPSVCVYVCECVSVCVGGCVFAVYEFVFERERDSMSVEGKDGEYHNKELECDDWLA